MASSKGTVTILLMMATRMPAIVVMRRPAMTVIVLLIVEITEP